MQNININIEANENATITINTPDGKKLVVEVVGDADGNEYWRDVYVSRVLPSGIEQDICCAELKNSEDNTGVFVWTDECSDSYTHEFSVKLATDDED